MGEWEEILNRFDYDLWANREWLAALERKGQPSPDIEVFGHLLSAQSIWLSRCRGTSPGEMPKVHPSDAAMVELNQGWKKVLQKGEDRNVAFKRTTGEALSLSISRIAWHVLNHGTYHRGELRGLCRARGDTDFPETDLARFDFLA